MTSQSTQGIDRTEPTTPDPDDPRKPDDPTDLEKRTWWYVAKKVWREFGDDQCTDLAAALTYYGVLAIFPAVLALSAILGLVGQSEKSVQTVLDVHQPPRLRGCPRHDRAHAARARLVPDRRVGAAARCGDRVVVGVGLRRRLRPRDEPDLRDR